MWAFEWMRMDGNGSEWIGMDRKPWHIPVILSLKTRPTLYVWTMQVSRSKPYGRILQQKFRNQRKMEAVLRREKFWIFSDDFRRVSAGNYTKLTGIQRKKSIKLSARLLLPSSDDFQYFPVGSEGLSRRILWDPVAVIFDLGR